jgi:hypothetical protein
MAGDDRFGDKGALEMRGRAAALTVRMGPLAFALLALSACGEGEEEVQNPQEKPRQFGLRLTGPEALQAAVEVHGYFEARAERRWVRACSYLAESSRRAIHQLAAQSRSFPGTDCPSFIASITKRLSPSERAVLARVKVDSVRADGDRGFVLYRVLGDGQRAMPIRAEGDTWKLAAPSGTPLPAS